MLGKILLRYLARYKWLLAAVLVFQFASALATLYPVSYTHLTLPTTPYV